MNYFWNYIPIIIKSLFADPRLDAVLLRRNFTFRNLYFLLTIFVINFNHIESAFKYLHIYYLRVYFFLFSIVTMHSFILKVEKCFV